MTKFFAAAAISAVLATPVLADGHSAQVFIDQQMLGTKTLHSSELVGSYVYTTDVEFTYDKTIEADTEWNNIGEIRDIVLSADGKIRSVLLDVGGFLGIGEHTVAVNMDQLKFVNDEDDAGDYFIVVKATKDELMNAPAVDLDKIGSWAD